MLFNIIILQKNYDSIISAKYKYNSTYKICAYKNSAYKNSTCKNSTCKNCTYKNYTYKVIKLYL